MAKFSKKWFTFAGKKILQVRPPEGVTTDQWMSFFKIELKNYRKPDLYMLVDLLGYQPNIGYDGYMEAMEMFKSKNIKRIWVAILSLNYTFEYLAELLEISARHSKIELKSQSFKSNKNALHWLRDL